MSYQKVSFTKDEREYLHRRGYWIDREGKLLLVSEMSYERLGKLVKLLAEWAIKESDPIEYLKRQPILNHVYNRIVHFKMKNFHTGMFKSAVGAKMVSNEPKMETLEDEMFCLTHNCWGRSSLDKKHQCVWVSCPPPELESDWEQHVTYLTPSELEL